MAGSCVHALPNKQPWEGDFITKPHELQFIDPELEGLLDGATEREGTIK